MPTRRAHPLVSKPDPHLADGSPWRTGPGRKRGVIAKALVTLCLSAAVALLAYARVDIHVKPCLEQFWQALHRG